MKKKNKHGSDDCSRLFSRRRLIGTHRCHLTIIITYLYVCACDQTATTEYPKKKNNNNNKGRGREGRHRRLGGMRVVGGAPSATTDGRPECQKCRVYPKTTVFGYQFYYYFFFRKSPFPTGTSLLLILGVLINAELS